MRQSSSTSPALFHHAARDAIKAFPPDVRRSVGKAIWDLQRGARLAMPLSRPMPAVGRGVQELRIKEPAGAFRVFYCLVTIAGVLVIHAFQKKSQQTPRREIELAQKRLQELLDEST